MFLYDASLAGGVDLAGAHISGDLECTASSLHHLDMRGASVEGNVFLRRSFSQKVSLRSVQIKGDLSCRGGTFGMVSLWQTSVQGVFFWRDENAISNQTKLELTNASVGA